MSESGKSRSSKEYDPMGAGGEYRTGPVAGTALVAGKTFDLKALQYAEIEGLAVFEGDIVLGRVSDMRTAAAAETGELPQFAVGITGPDVRWRDATVPYDIDPSLPNQQRVTDAIAHWEANTRIRFVLRTSANQNQHPDYVHFIPSTGCWSYVGRRGGMQELGLAAGCSMGNAIHEIGHAVGLWHEQSREDRDTFVRIEWTNIDPNAQHNFNQHIADGEDLGPYDYGSIMHYPATAFSINGQPTIVALQPMPPGVVMGQRNGLSQGDIGGVHTMYPQIVVTIKEVRKDPIRDTIKEVGKDPIQDTLKEVRKDPIQDTLKEIRKDPIRDTIKEVRKDPIWDPIGKQPPTDPPIQPARPGRPWDAYPGVSALPFVTGSPSRVPQSGAEAVAEAGARVQELAESLLATEQQLAGLLAAYDEAVQMLEALSGERA